MRACATGDTEAVPTLLAEEPALARERLTGETTGLHLAGPHPDVVRVLLAHGADPNARDGGDNATPLHFAAAQGNVDSVRLLLDAGDDVHGTGDVHNGEVIGWAAQAARACVPSSRDLSSRHELQERALRLGCGGRHSYDAVSARRERHEHDDDD
jgi:hypothetical protein